MYLTQRKRTFKCDLNPNDEALEQSPHIHEKESFTIYRKIDEKYWFNLTMSENKNEGMVSRKSRHLSISLIRGRGIDLMQILWSNVFILLSSRKPV